MTDDGASLAEPRRDVQTVTPAGERVGRLIEGVCVRPAVTQVDERGEICEIYNPAWGVVESPLVYVYQVCVRPGRIKGWVVHRQQDDRLFASLGALKIVLFDARRESPTHRMVNEIFVGERNRALVVIPAGVFHAVQNVGATDALFVNMPTRPYDHAEPDKYRLPIDTDEIPYRFDSVPGW